MHRCCHLLGPVFHVHVPCMNEDAGAFHAVGRRQLLAIANMAPGRKFFKQALNANER